MTDEEIVMAMRRRFSETFRSLSDVIPEFWEVSREELEAYERWLPTVDDRGILTRTGRGPLFKGVELVERPT